MAEDPHSGDVDCEFFLPSDPGIRAVDSPGYEQLLHFNPHSVQPIDSHADHQMGFVCDHSHTV